jgi:putative transposase
MQSQIGAQEAEEDFGIDERYQIPEELWGRIEPLLPPPPKRKNEDRPGRPRMDNRKAMNGIFYVLRTGIQWKALPRSLGAASTVHDRFQEWGEAGLFETLWKEGLLEYDEKRGSSGSGRPWTERSRKRLWAAKGQDPTRQTGPRLGRSGAFS